MLGRKRSVGDMVRKSGVVADIRPNATSPQGIKRCKVGDKNRKAWDQRKDVATLAFPPFFDVTGNCCKKIIGPKH